MVKPTFEGRRSLQRRESEYGRYWDSERETMLPDQRNELILKRIQHQLAYAYHTIPFYRRHYDAHKFHPDQVQSLQDFTQRVPIITKKMLVADQQEHPPFGSYLGVPQSQLLRIHGSSGTSGTPTMYGISKSDWEHTADVCRIALWSAGVRPDDIVQISFPFGLFLGGWGLLQACEFVGACAFPVGSLMPTDQQITQLIGMQADVLVATPSYAQHLGRRAAELGIDLSETNLGVVIVAGEPGGSIPEIRKTMSAGLGGAAVVDLGAGASSEMHPFYANVGCRYTDGGVHLMQDENYTEIVSKDDPNAPVPVGSSGAVVATHLWRESQPMIRFWLGDEGHIDDTPCTCGRTYPRLPKGVYGRLDDMLLVRGANIYPSAVDAVIRRIPGAGREYRIVVERIGELDEITVKVERASDLSETEGAQLQQDIESQLRDTLMIRTKVQVLTPDSFELQMFKARRVIDRRRT